MTRLYRQPHPQRELFSSDRFFLASCKNQTFQRGLCMIDYEKYRGDIEKVIEDYRVAHGGKKTVQLGAAGRYAIDPVFIFKCIVTQRALGLADDAMHDQMLCDARVREHLGINRPEDVPSAKTLWKYKNIFAQTDLMTTIFADHINEIKQINEDIGTKAVIIDSSFVEAPKQHNTREENKMIKQGKGQQLWNDNPHKKCHKDIDASWTKKRKETHYGYKGHFTVCAASKLVVDVFPTTAKTHDANPDVINKYLPLGKTKGLLLFADAGYTGKEIQEKMAKAHLVPMICEKGYKGHPLTAEQKQSNKELSHIRSRVEHVFGFIQNTLKGSIVRSVGMVRAKFNILLTALVYNMYRLDQIVRKTPPPREAAT